MPIIGWLMGFSFANHIVAFDYWVAFILLSTIGGKMLWESYKKDEDIECVISFPFKLMLTLAFATSIDALAVGVGFAVMGEDILTASSIIGITAFVMSMLGVVLGSLLGVVLKKKAERLGAIMLIGIGIKILVQRLVM